MSPQTSNIANARVEASGPGAFRIRRFLVAFDGSDQSVCAINVAGVLAGRLGAEIVVVTCFSTPMLVDPESGYDPNVRAIYASEAKATLGKAKAILPRSLQVETVLREGHPVTEILATAKAHDVDLIIMGTHARGRFAGALLGSVAHAVARRSDIPTMFVTHACAPSSGVEAEPDEQLVSERGGN